MTWEEAKPEVIAFFESEWRTWAIDAFIDERLMLKRHAVIHRFKSSNEIDYLE